jgi:hypothetical protein
MISDTQVSPLESARYPANTSGWKGYSVVSPIDLARWTVSVLPASCGMALAPLRGVLW